ncbi:hypothetical protein BT96DRAFT_1020492 [Gymnopus androsaceus JB14]|uniref:F-box domain-containing protein n=1 Tax=Gymnopus androsaceus JB14 TaxID=1447944 RepID=A0A6A4HLU0_9AGAR|nr:hypothetical protein BT96DRAFT_1020492 [Gymnopus androsaceus JB14]
MMEALKRSSKAWVRSSQRGIFQEIFLELPLLEEDFDTLVDAYLKTTRHLDTLFAEKPYLASYVRSLKLKRFLTQTDYDNKQVTVPEVVYTAAASLVRRLSNLSSLSFDYVFWEGLPPLLQAALTEICAASLTQFSASYFYIPTFAELVSLLSCMRSLKILDVRVECDDWNVPSSLSSDTEPQRIQLSNLRLGFCRPFITWFQQDGCPFEVRNLNLLEIDSDETTEILQYLDISLKELKLHNTGPGGPNMSSAHLGCNPNLRRLSLISDDRQFDDSIAWIQYLFEPLLNPDGNLLPLQHLTIVLFDRNPVRDPLVPRQWDQWSTIDALLEKPEFASLQMVVFKLGYLHLPGDVSKVLSERLPFLEGSGKLVVQIVDVDEDD